MVGVADEVRPDLTIIVTPMPIGTWTPAVRSMEQGNRRRSWRWRGRRC
jgi:hypothetical protein